MSDTTDSSSPYGPVGSPEFIAARRAAMANCKAPPDDGPAMYPVGHAYGIRTSTRITSGYRKTHRSGSLDVQPGEVIEVLQKAEIKDWVLMGLHGYVGYMHDPRATQDVGVQVAHEVKDVVVTAIADRWPTLVVSPSEVVVRFKDPGELDPEGRAKPVIDVMLPWSNIHAEILRSQVVIDDETGHRLPTIEAALAGKYAAMVSPNRTFTKKGYDATDFRIIVQCNQDDIDLRSLRRLAALVWDGGEKEILEFVEMAIRDEPFSL